ncbi:MAG: DUF5668 domain-containing protein [bacterium]
MFFAIVLIVIGLFLLLNALGILSGSFWGFFWAVIFLALGFKLLIKRGCCPMCDWGNWKKRMNDDCCGSHRHDNEQN